MRIWLLTSELPQEFAGGIARYIENFARLLGASGHEVVIISRMRQACDTVVGPGVQVIGVVPRHTSLNQPNPGGLPDTHPAYPYNVLAYWPALSYQLAEEVLRLLQHLPSPDIIESQEYGALPYYLLQRKLTERTPLERVPILVHLHGPTFELARFNQEPRYRFPEYWVGQMEKFCLVAADALLAPSSFLASGIAQTLGRALDVVTIPYPLTVHHEIPRQQAQPGQIVYVGRLELRKGVLPLVKACSRLWQEGENFQLTLIGGDQEFIPRNITVGAFIRQRYSHWIEQGCLRLAGQLDHATVLACMRQAWAIVVPSLWENFPNTCLEAMELGQVVLASRAGGQVEMIETDGGNGFLFDWNQAGDFERQLRVVLALSEGKRTAIGQCAQARIRALCAPESILSQRVCHYETVRARHAPRRFFPIVNPGPTGRTAPGLHVEAETLAVSDEQPGLLSVVIPYYNLGDYLDETLDSILATTYTPYEVLIVNDGSTEPASLRVLQEIDKRGLAQVRILHTENQGLASARNTGVAAARGEFVTFVDGDDLVEPGFFTRAIAVLQRYPNVAFVYSWVRYFGESTDIWPTWNAEFPYLLGHNMLSAFAVVRRSAFLRWARNKPELEYSLEDFEGWLALLQAGGIGVSLPHLLVRYRVRAGSMYRGANWKQLLYLYDVITQYHADAYREWGLELFNLQNANGPGCRWNHPATEAAEVSTTYVAALEQERSKLAAEVRTLGKAWEDHAQFIAAQRAYIESLEVRCRELLATGRETGALTTANGIPWRDYELGGWLVNRARHTWLGRYVLRYPLLKSALKKTLGRGARSENDGG
jgi:glycosyltransferase involved in cell wall biosynthesis